MHGHYKEQTGRAVHASVLCMWRQVLTGPGMCHTAAGQPAKRPTHIKRYSKGQV
jgi:hypothetical protein